jgi:peroxiredoxin
VVDEKGVILKVFKKPKVRQHAEEIVEKTKEL